MTALNGSQRFRSAFAVALVACTGCTGSPAHDILGSYFPSWIVCALAGLLLALLVRQILVATNLDDAIPAPALVYLVMAVAFAFALWLLWLS
jgi:hypothetical protein